MKPFLIFFKGAIHHRSDPLFSQAEALSNAFDGEYWTYGSTPMEETSGSFKVHCLGCRDEGALGQIFSYAPRVIWHVLSNRSRYAGRQSVVISYDPFIHGLLASIVAWLIGAKLIVEMPGAYENSDRFPQGFKRRLSVLRQRILAQISVWRADAVRFIFPDQIRSFISIPRSKLVTIYFDPANITRFAGEQRAPEKLILLVGFPYYIKGCDILIEAWQRISHAYPDWRLVLIGHELELYRNEVQAREHRIDFLKSMPNAEVANWVSRADIFALPSRSDALPRVLMEAAAAAKARVGSRVDGIPRLITDGVDGLLVPPKDAAALADALGQLLDDEPLRRRLGRAAQARVFREFSIARYIEDLDACISQLQRSPKPLPEARDQRVRSSAP